MTTAPFDFTTLLPPSLPPPAARWTDRVKYDFTGGNNDPDALPLDGLIAAADAVLRREGRTLSTYRPNSGPQGYRALRDFLVGKLKRDAGIACSADDILITSGSLQAVGPGQPHPARARRHGEVGTGDQGSQDQRAVSLQHRALKQVLQCRLIFERSDQIPFKA